jgi:hypothetical protein
VCRTNINPNSPYSALIIKKLQEALENDKIKKNKSKMKAQNKDKFNLKYNPNHKIKGIPDIDPVITEKLPFTHIFASFVSTRSPSTCKKNKKRSK